MLKTFSLLFFLFCIAFHAFAGPGTGVENWSPSPSEEGGCSLPAPASFNVVEVGPTHITVSWSPVFGAAQYRLKVTNLTTSTPVSDQYVSAGTLSFTQSGLVPNNNYRFQIFSVCSNGITSEHENTLEQRTIIIELVLEASNYSTTPSEVCSPAVGPSTPGVTNFYCSFTGSGTGTTFWLEVRETLDNKRVRYNVEILNSTSTRFVTGKVAPSGYIEINSITTTNENGTAPEPSGFNERVPCSQVRISSASTLIGTFTLFSGGSTIIVSGSVASGYSFYVLKVASGRPADNLGAGEMEPSDTGAEGRTAINPLAQTVVVNPFSTSLDTRLPQAPDAPVTLTLYTLDGRRQQQQQFPAGTTHCSLPTADLPRGLYLLRLESGGRQETVKVIKTE